MIRQTDIFLVWQSLQIYFITDTPYYPAEREAFMKKYIIFPLLFLSTLFMAGCGNKDTTDDNSLVVLNYGKYMDSSVLKLFEQETGIHVKLEEYESPEEMYTKYKAGSIG